MIQSDISIQFHQPESSLQKVMWHWTNQIAGQLVSMETLMYPLIWLVYLYSALWLVNSYLGSYIMICRGKNPSLWFYAQGINIIEKTQQKNIQQQEGVGFRIQRIGYPKWIASSATRASLGKITGKDMSRHVCQLKIKVSVWFKLCKFVMINHKYLGNY